MVSSELSKQESLTEEEKFDRELDEMADDLGVGSIGNDEHLKKLSVSN